MLNYSGFKMSMVVNPSSLDILMAFMSSVGILITMAAGVHLGTKKSSDLLDQIRTTNNEIKEIELEKEHDKELELVKQIEAFDLENQDKMSRSDYINYLKSIKKLVEMNPEKGIEILKKTTLQEQPIINVDELNKSVEKSVSEQVIISQFDDLEDFSVEEKQFINEEKPIESKETIEDEEEPKRLVKKPSNGKGNN